MLAASGGWCESPGSVRRPVTWVLLVLSPVTYYLVEAPMQRVGHAPPGGWTHASGLTA